MNIKAKVPMNSASSFGAIRLDMVDSRDEIRPLGALRFAPGNNALVGDGRRHRRAPSAGEAGLLRGDRLRFEIDAQRLRDASAVCGIGLVAVNDLPLDDLDRHAPHRCPVVLEELFWTAVISRNKSPG